MKRFIGNRLTGPLLVLAFVYLVVIMLAKCIHGAPAFPPISFLADELKIKAGQPFPKGVIWNGRPYYFYVVSAKELPNGKYAVIIGAR